MAAMNRLRKAKKRAKVPGERSALGEQALDRLALVLAGNVEDAAWRQKRRIGEPRGRRLEKRPAGPGQRPHDGSAVCFEKQGRGPARRVVTRNVFAFHKDNAGPGRLLAEFERRRRSGDAGANDKEITLHHCLP